MLSNLSESSGFTTSSRFWVKWRKLWQEMRHRQTRRGSEKRLRQRECQTEGLRQRGDLLKRRQRVWQTERLSLSHTYQSLWHPFSFPLTLRLPPALPLPLPLPPLLPLLLLLLLLSPCPLPHLILPHRHILPLPRVPSHPLPRLFLSLIPQSKLSHL